MERSWGIISPGSFFSYSIWSRSAGISSRSLATRITTSCAVPRLSFHCLGGITRPWERVGSAQGSGTKSIVLPESEISAPKLNEAAERCCLAAASIPSSPSRFPAPTLRRVPLFFAKPDALGEKFLLPALPAHSLHMQQSRHTSALHADKGAGRLPARSRAGWDAEMLPCRGPSSPNLFLVVTEDTPRWAGLCWPGREG